MTLGDNPQPLTRRQARERARGQEPTAAEEQTSERTAGATAATDGHSSSGSRRAGTAEVTSAGDEPKITSFTELIRQVGSPTAVPSPSPFAPGDARKDKDRPVTMSAKEKDTERTLTRRELRALMDARPASGEDAEPDDDDVMRDDSVRPAPLPLDPPVGHWSINRDVDDDVHNAGQPFDQLMSRGVAAGGVPTTTNALILPVVPNQGGVSGPIDATGEILITGSIDLPRSLGSTGQHPNHFDSADVDHMLDQLDEGAPATSVAPVSASRAVSTHTSTRGVMTPPKKHVISLPAVLAITAAVLALGVVGLFIGGYVLRVF